MNSLLSGFVHSCVAGMALSVHGLDPLLWAWVGGVSFCPGRRDVHSHGRAGTFCGCWEVAARTASPQQDRGAGFARRGHLYLKLLLTQGSTSGRGCASAQPSR
jgi:hypothetical protein